MMPKTYFSTPLSKSVKDTEGRIRNIFQGQRRRPAVIALALVAAVALLCGSVVALREEATPEKETIPGQEAAAREIAAVIVDEPESDPNIRRVPFTDILGLDGWYEEERFQNGVVRRYISSDCVWFASSDGDDYVLDLDGDGVMELICNNGNPDWYTDVKVYRRSGNFIQDGLLFYDMLDLPGRKVFEGKRGKGQISSRYDSEREAFVVTYATEDGEAEWVFTDYGPFDFSYLGGHDITAVQGAPRYLEVLRGETTFFSEDAQEWLMLSELQRAVPESGVEIAAASFAAVNLDRNDTVDDVILALERGGESSGCLVLHASRGGDVHGIFLPESAFSALKADGTFFWTDGATNWGSAMLDLTQKDHRVCAIRRAFTYYENGAYAVDGERATEAAFREAVQLQDAKEDVAWYEFTAENIRAVLGEET